MKFGDNIKNLRISISLSQEELAEKVGVSRQSISKWECGESYPTWNNIPILCNIFNCDINDLASVKELGKIIDLENLKTKSMKIESVNTSDIIKKMESLGIDKSIIDTIPRNPFDDLINTLENDYISKSDGIERIKFQLDKWDIKARKSIIVSLLRRLGDTGIVTVSDLIELVELI